MKYLLLLSMFILFSCKDNTEVIVIQPTPIPTVSVTSTPTTTSWWKPKPNVKWQIQFAGDFKEVPGAVIYDLDGIDTPQETIAKLKAKGIAVICYFSGGSYEEWRDDAKDFPAKVKGKKLDGWAGENWLDVRQVEILGNIMTKRMVKLKTKGCDAVDPDNMDGFANKTGFPLTYDDQLKYNKLIASIAHSLDMGVGLKNDLLQIKDLADTFDFAINESCWDYDECHYMLPFIERGKAVLGIEYKKEAKEFCPKANSLNFDFVKKNQNLDHAVEYCR